MNIKGKKDMFNGGRCFTKGKTYSLLHYREVSEPYGLIDAHVINDMGERHLIGMWYRNFKIIN